MSSLAIEIDLSRAQSNAERAAAMLRALRERHDLSPFEYARTVRIAPFEIPVSHPVLTINTSCIHDETAFLRHYLHEQIHWYETWFANKHSERWNALLATLGARYPDAPIGRPEGAGDLRSTLLHLVVNWFEIACVGSLIGPDNALAHIAAHSYVYRWCYRTAAADYEALGALYRETGLAPMIPASRFSDDDRALAARATDMPI